MNPKLIDRVRLCNDQPINTDGKYILYWMIANRRLNHNAALEYAAEMAVEHNVPLLVLEEISTSHRFANDRICTFMIQGMLENMQLFKDNKIRYIPWVETPLSGIKGILHNLSEDAVMVVTDDYPTYFPLKAVRYASNSCNRRMVAVDSNGVFPMAWTERAYPTAHGFRRFVHQRFIECMETWPKFNPIPEGENVWLPDELFEQLSKKWQFHVTPFEWLWRVGEIGSAGREALSTIDIDHTVPAVAHARGGRSTCIRMLHEFLTNRLYRYADDRNAVSAPATSGLSPWLHFGHISTIEIIQNILQTNSWDPETVQMPRKGSREGWWNLDRSVEGFLDQIITWRELGFNNAYHNPDHDKYESLPNWAQTTLMEHASDERVQYTFDQIRDADTHDEIWNAAQRQLVRDGIIHNYLRMLWGKRILEWAPSPQIAAEWMIELNDKFALDGRDPNSYTGIFWVLGRHDRAWGPERAIFGKIRYMSSANTRRKFDLKPYLQEFR